MCGFEPATSLTDLSAALAAVVDVVLFLALADQTWHATVALTLAKLHAISLLTILNSRMKIRDGRWTRDSTVFHDTFGRIEFATGSPGPQEGREGRRGAVHSPVTAIALSRLPVTDVFDDDNASTIAWVVGWC